MTTRVSTENRDQFVRWSHRAAHLAHKERGHLYSTLIENPDPRQPDDVIEFFVIYGFDCLANLKRWHDSETKNNLMAERKELMLISDVEHHPTPHDVNDNAVDDEDDDDERAQELYHWGTTVHRAGWEVK
jgi:antibiotic biosynthesis monooxygenase (ABM) superfamily enzyme